jgi:hypothetical protein
MGGVFMQAKLCSSALLLSAALGVGAIARGDCPTPAPRLDDLERWADVYLRWMMGERTLPLDEHGNPVLGRTVLLPIPPTPGDGTPGSEAVTLDRRESFALPLWGLIGTTYLDGSPPDPVEPIGIFETLDILVTLDGVPLITTGNVLDFYTGFALDPPIAVDDPVYATYIWYETVIIVHEPLPCGVHTLELYAINTEPVFGEFSEYDNTWTLTVTGE